MSRLFIRATLCLFILFVLSSCSSKSNKIDENPSISVPLGDPFIMLYNGTYYAYGTHRSDGIEVYSSSNLEQWELVKNGRNGLALLKDDVWADKNFWAPEVYFVNNKFYMYYSADEHICVAMSNSPLGPFIQNEKEPMIADKKCIDNSLFIDDDGKAYLLFDRLEYGANNIWIAELEEDLITVKEETMHFCFGATQPWEQKLGSVNEGASIIKHNDVYYMTYSGNSFESKDYGVGYAIATNIMGDWEKSDTNPILQRPGKLVGVGHSALFMDKEGNTRIVFHAHHNSEVIHPRAMYISTIHFVKNASVDYMTVGDGYIKSILKI